MCARRDERHRYGQHYTPQEVARLLAAFAVREAGDVIIDPACGDGRLLREALIVKKALASGGAHGKPEHEVYGLDRSMTAIQLAALTGARVAARDFFDVAPCSRTDRIRLPRLADAIIGNPPYIRQEVIGRPDKARIEARLVRDREALPHLSWPRWSGRSDIYVYFFAHASGFLRPGGRLVFLTASSWLDVDYGRALRDFLLDNFRIIAIVESEAESFFADASINTAITVVERESEAPARAENLVRFVRLSRSLGAIESAPPASAARGDDPPHSLAAQIEGAMESMAIDEYRIRVIEQKRLTSDCAWERAAKQPRTRIQDAVRVLPQGPSSQASGWGKYLRAEDIFFDILERGRSRLRPLSGLASVRFGVKTGANEFFYVSADDRRRGEPNATSLPRTSGVASVRRGITTGANEFFYLTRPSADPRTRHPESLAEVLDGSGVLHRIEPRFLSEVVFSLKELAGIVLDRVDGGRLFFHCSEDRDRLAGTGALDYIRYGERAGLDKRPTCASRAPWYSVTNGRKPAPLIFPSKIGERWLIALNRARVFEDKKLYGVFPAAGVRHLALAAVLNSTWARYYAETTCRQMTGAQAIADIDVAVAERILIPDPRELSPSLRRKLESALVTLTRRPVYSIFEEVKRADRRRLDALTLEAIGFDGSNRDAVLDRLYTAAAGIVRARLARTAMSTT